ncbi:MAG: carboxymuconolactone decarboxylase family protein [Burkholderiaceae bacterium]|nr:carboxymuconolactone decarboxylase family protein [Burkholderiaceae bacterium]
MASEKYERGMKSRRKLMGDAYVDAALAKTTALDREFQEMTVENVWGRSWSRGILTHHELSLINLALLVGLNRMKEFELHIRLAVKTTKVPPAKIREVLNHITVYCGVPAGLEAFKITRRVLEEEGIPESIFEGGPN